MEKWRGARGVPGVEKEDPGVRRRAERLRPDPPPPHPPPHTRPRSRGGPGRAPQGRKVWHVLEGVVVGGQVCEGGGAHMCWIQLHRCGWSRARVLFCAAEALAIWNAFSIEFVLYRI
jgi:hypothetical protein